MEVIETVTLSKATSIEYVKLREIWNDSLAKGEMPEYVTIHEDIDAMIALIYLNTRAHRVKNSPKVKELASKYPARALWPSLCLKTRSSLFRMIWTEQIIAIIDTPN